MSVSLDALPFDVVLKIFYHLSARDIVRTCRTCKYLGAILKEHHVWLDLVEDYCSRSSTIARYIRPLTARSTDELRAFVVDQVLLDRYWAMETVFAKRLPYFTFQSSALVIFHALLPGGKHVVLVHNNGDIYLQSLVDLNNVHEISSISLDVHGRYVPYTTSLVGDYKGRTLLVLGAHSIPQSIFFFSLEIEASSINLVKRLELDFKVIDVALRHDTIVCLCQYIERSSFCLVITTLDGAAQRTFPITGMANNRWSISLPTPTTLLIFRSSNILSYHLPALSELAPGDHQLSELAPVWSWESPTILEDRVTSNHVHWEPGRTGPTIVTLTGDSINHKITLCPSEKSPGSSHLDVANHTSRVRIRSNYSPNQDALLQSQKGIQFVERNLLEPSRDILLFSNGDAEGKGFVRLDVSRAGIWKHVKPTVSFDEVSGRIIVLAGYGYVVDMPRA